MGTGHHSFRKINWAPSLGAFATGYPDPAYSLSCALPAGLSLNAATGIISGTTSANGSYPCTVTAQNSAGSATQNLVLTVRTNVALASAGAVASASSSYSAGYPAAAVNNNDRTGYNWGSGGGWADATPNSYPDWVQIDFNGSKTIERVEVYSLQDNFTAPAEPTDTLSFTTFGVTDFTVQGWNGTAWVTLGTASGNNLVKRAFDFAAFTTGRIRVNVTGALGSGGYSKIVEIEALGSESRVLYYIHADHLDTPRVITDTAGNTVWQWDNVDPFGNNIPNENPNGAGQFSFNLRFPGQYFDRETNTHYNVNRDYDPAIGRYIESDPIGLDGGINTYAYVGGNPLRYGDPSGLSPEEAARIMKNARNAIDEMTRDGYREDNWYVNNAKALLPFTKNERCADQSADVATSVSVRSQLKDYSVDIHSDMDSKLWFLPGHFWVEAHSRDVADPVIIIDPLHNTITPNP